MPLRLHVRFGFGERGVNGEEFRDVRDIKDGANPLRNPGELEAVMPAMQAHHELHQRADTRRIHERNSAHFDDVHRASLRVHGLDKFAHRLKAQPAGDMHDAQLRRRTRIKFDGKPFVLRIHGRRIYQCCPLRL